MEDNHKSNKQLRDELEKLRRRVAELESAEAERGHAERALQASEEKYRNLVENVNVGIFVFQDQKVVYLNPAVSNLMDYSQEELEAFSNPFDFLHPDDRKMVLEHHFKRLSGENAPESYDLRLVDKHETIRWLRIFPIRIDWEGSPAALIFLSDITELKRTEEALRENEQRFRSLVETTGDLIWEIDRHGKYSYVSPKSFNLLGYRPEEVIGKRPFDFMPADEAKRAIEFFKTKSDYPKSFSLMEFNCLHKTGRQITSEVSGVPFFDGDGNLLGWRGIDRDITARKDAEEKLRKSGEQYRNLVNTIEELIWELDINGTYTYVSPQSRAVYGLEPEQMLGKTPFELMPPEEGKRVASIFKEITATREPFSGLETVTMHGDGRRVSLETWGFPFFSPDGALMGYRGLAIDITKRKQDQEEKKRLQNLLEETKKMEAIATLAGGIAHDFNNALFGITGNIELLEQDFYGDKSFIRYTTPMKAASRRMTNLTNQLLAYARGGKYKTEIISLNDFVKDTLPLIENSLSSGIRVVTDLTHDVSEVEADFTQMQMIFSSIMANSEEAIEKEGCIRISTKFKQVNKESAKRHAGLKPGVYIHLSIEDDGKGMDEETKSRIFEPFFSTKFQGRGLGMAAVYGIIKNHRGFIYIDSEPDRGTAVDIYLPAQAPLAKEEEKPGKKLFHGSGTILLVEDEELVMDISREILERSGYNVLQARNGTEAIQISRTFDLDIDLVLLDIGLPDMPGEKVYLQIMEARPDMKVVLCSGYSIDGPAQRILNAGAKGFIQKPYSFQTLTAKLEEVMKGH